MKLRKRHQLEAIDKFHSTMSISLGYFLSVWGFVFRYQNLSIRKRTLSRDTSLSSSQRGKTSEKDEDDVDKTYNIQETESIYIERETDRSSERRMSDGAGREHAALGMETILIRSTLDERRDEG
ncbi:uncharacterized protein MCYG_08731 [Microsporum canis CBS 113480]|uniref:Uncharacterized protein n=1 Tax=Arthroderma otae (strain ATCC MYA-4605 / CBS 113480) TaxID=554155 RepID=C5G1A9_ARTOC|nr:uncharacterized protein MCYG_08731 [Microsporum canis CBS 113480]EEQ28572.1 predicted protein [Microsporum canis CBS 113480]